MQNIFKKIEIIFQTEKNLSINFNLNPKVYLQSS